MECLVKAHKAIRTLLIPCITFLMASCHGHVPQPMQETSGVPDQLLMQRLQRAGRPLLFTENVGQYRSEIRYAARHAQGMIGFGDDEIVLTLLEPLPDTPGAGATRSISFAGMHRTRKVERVAPTQPMQRRVVTLRHLGARSCSALRASDEAEMTSTYLVGNDPDDWYTDVRSYRRLRYAGLYPGIDLSYTGVDGHLKSEYIVAPAADWRSIRLQYDGVDSLVIDPAGDLVIHAGATEVREQRPFAYQWTMNGLQSCAVRYVLLDRHTVGYELGSYDDRLPLVLDPVYSTLLGGNGADGIVSIVQRDDGTVVAAGTTSSSDFPWAADAYCDTSSGSWDTFITVFHPAADVILSSTYYGGNSYDAIVRLHEDKFGRIVTAGITQSSNLPMVGSPWAGNNAGDQDCFVAVFDIACTRLLSSTYLGGVGFDALFGMMVDDSGYVYVTGLTDSRNFPTTAGAFQRQYGGGEDDVFVTKLSADCSALVFSTFIGGADYDEGYKLVLTPSGDICVTGMTLSTNFPITADAYQRSIGRYEDGCFVILDATGGRMLYGTRLGGNGHEFVEDVLFDEDSTVTLLCTTASGDLPVTPGAYQSEMRNRYDNLYTDAYLCSFRLRSQERIAATYLGGRKSDQAISLFALDLAHIAIVATSNSDDIPIRGKDAIGSSGGHDVFVGVLSRDMKTMSYGTYYGGGGDDYVNLAYESGQIVSVVGFTLSPDLPIVGKAVQTDRRGATDGFLAIFDLTGVTSAGTADGYPDRRSAMHLRNHPNPFRVRTEIEYDIPVAGIVSLTIHDSQGRLVRTLVYAHRTAGTHTVPFTAEGFPAGIYYGAITSGVHRTVHKLLLLQ